jgi:hypothetical protein
LYEAHPQYADQFTALCNNVNEPAGGIYEEELDICAGAARIELEKMSQ